MENKKEIVKFGAFMTLLNKGIEEGIKELLNNQKEIKGDAEKYYIKENGNEEEGIYHNEVAFASFQLEVIGSILQFKGLHEERKHIKLLSDELRTIADDLEKLI